MNISTGNLSKLVTRAKVRGGKKDFVRSIEDAAVRAVVTATVTFAVGLLLKRMFEKSVSKAAEEGAKSGVEEATPVGDNGASPPIDE